MHRIDTLTTGQTPSSAVAFYRGSARPRHTYFYTNATRLERRGGTDIDAEGAQVQVTEKPSPPWMAGHGKLARQRESGGRASG
jgi:hypothetical protein